MATPDLASDPETQRLRASVMARIFGEELEVPKIGRYPILARLGQGAMGVVYACYDAELDRRIAVKVVRGDIASPSVRARMVREAQAMAKLSHPNVAHVYEVGEHEGRMFVTMELVKGQTLREWLQAAPRHWSDVLQVCLAAGRGLAAAHAEGLTHRDFKPDNVMVGDDGRVRVMDFGLVRRGAKRSMQAMAEETAPAAAQIGLELTRRGALLGTPAYMAPEQLRDAEGGPRADQFAYCVTLWEALYGRRPFEGDSLPALAARIESGHVARPGRSRAPRGVEAVLRRGLRHDPCDRHADLKALFDALDRAVRPTKRWRWVRLVLLTVAILLGIFWSLWKLRVQAEVEDLFVLMVIGQPTPDELIASADAFFVEHSDAPPINLAIVRLARARASWLSSCPDPDADGLCLSPRPRRSDPGCRSSPHDSESVQPRDPARAETAVVELRSAIESIGPFDLDHSSKRGRRLAEVLDAARLAVADDALERYLAMSPPLTTISDPRELATPAWRKWLEDKRANAVALERPWHQISAVTSWAVAVPLRRGVAHQSLADDLLSLGLPAEPAARHETCAALAPIVDEAERGARSAFAECIALVERTPDSASLAMTCHEMRDHNESAAPLVSKKRD